MNSVCVDASFALAAVLPDPQQAKVIKQWKAWGDHVIVAPWIFAFETHSVLRRKVWKKELRSHEAQSAWEILLGFEIQLQHHENLWQEAWMLAERYNRPTTYDATYLALARLVACNLWTLDQAFFSAVARHETRLRTV